MTLSISTTERGARSVVHVKGEIDVYTAPTLRERLDELVSAGRTHLVLDLSEVGFLDSTGLGVLVGRLKLVRLHGGSLQLVCSDERILKVFAITGLEKVFVIYGSVDDAVADAVAEAGADGEAGDVVADGGGAGSGSNAGSSGNNPGSPGSNAGKNPGGEPGNNPGGKPGSTPDGT